MVTWSLFQKLTIPLAKFEWRVPDRIVDSARGLNDENVYIGEKGCKQSLSHGSIVALHCGHHNRFLRLRKGGADSHTPQDIDRLPHYWEFELFLVVQLASDECALYNIGTDQFLAMNGEGQLTGLWPIVEPLSAGFTDQTFIEQIPKDAVFTVSSERSDDGTVSLYSPNCRRFVRMLDNGVVDGGAKRVLAWERFQILVVMDSSSIIQDRVFIPQSSTGHCSILAQSVKVFKDWTHILPTATDCKLGNLVAVTQVHPTSGHILFPFTEIFAGCKSPSHKEIRLGKMKTKRCLSSGNVVALYNWRHSRFVRIMEGQASTAHDSAVDELRLGWGCEQFLVISHGNDHEYSFYSVLHHQFLAMKRPDLVSGIRPSVDLRESPEDNEFVERIPEECIFVVKAEHSDHGQVSLYSKVHQRYITVHGNSTVDGAGTRPGDSETFAVVLLMDVEVLERPR
jgi:hypothetical protein